MLKKSTLEHVLNHDLSELWSVLRNDEKRLITDNFVIHNFKKHDEYYDVKQKSLNICGAS